VVRLAPPLVVSEQECDEALDLIAAALAQSAAGRGR